MKKIFILLFAIITLSCSKSTEPDTNTNWISISEFPNKIYIGNFNGYTEIDQHYNISNLDLTDWQMVEIDSNRVVNRWSDIENRFRIASSNPSKTPILNFNLAKASHVTLIITNEKGKIIKKLADNPFCTGLHCILFKGENAENNRIDPGLYRAHLFISDNSDSYFYSFGDFYLEAEFNWVQINQSAKEFAELHFSRDKHSEVNLKYIEAIKDYKYPETRAIWFSTLFWKLNPDEDNHQFYENIALMDQNIFGWDDWRWKFNFEEEINWEFEIIDGFKVWKGNRVTNPKDENYGKYIVPYSANREHYIQLLNE